MGGRSRTGPGRDTNLLARSSMGQVTPIPATMSPATMVLATVVPDAMEPVTTVLATEVLDTAVPARPGREPSRGMATPERPIRPTRKR